MKKGIHKLYLYLANVPLGLALVLNVLYLRFRWPMEVLFLNVFWVVLSLLGNLFASRCPHCKSFAPVMQVRLLNHAPVVCKRCGKMVEYI